MKKLLFFSSLFTLIGVARADTLPVTVIINSASPMTQGIGLVLSNQMQSQESQVHILLCDKAGDLALKESRGEKLKPQDLTPVQLLDNAMKKGATVSVCALYLPNSGHMPDQLKDGIAIAKPDAIARSILDPQHKTLTF